MHVGRTGKLTRQKTHSYDDRAILAHISMLSGYSIRYHTHLSLTPSVAAEHTLRAHTYTLAGAASVLPPRTERGHHCSELRA